MNSAAIIKSVATGQASACEVLESAIARIEATDGRVNAFTERTLQRARAEAAAVDARRARGEALPPLAGLPYAVKNLFDIEGVTTLAGSKINRELPPASSDAVLVQRLQACRRGAAGRAQHGRVRLRLHHREHALRADAQPARPDAHVGRLLGRLGRGRRRRAGAADAGLGHQRLDPRARVAVRRLGPEADLRAAVAARQLSLRAQHRPPGPAGRQRGGPGARRTTPCRAPIRWTRAATRCGCSPRRAALAAGVQGLRIGILGGYFHDNATPAARAVAALAARTLGATDEVLWPDAGTRPRRRLHHHGQRRRQPAPEGPAHARRRTSSRCRSTASSPARCSPPTGT